VIAEHAYQPLTASSFQLLYHFPWSTTVGFFFHAIVSTGMTCLYW
jgi:hypothetical protein